MRHFILSTLALATLAPAALAAGAPAPVLAELDVSGGLMPYRAHLTVQADGHVVLVSQRFNDPEVTKDLATLSSVTLTALSDRIAKIKPAELKDEQAGEPTCLDAGSETVLVYVAGQRVELRQWAGCHTYVREDNAGTEIVDLLNGFYRLAD